MKQKIRLLQRRTVHYLLAMTYWLTKRLPIQSKKVVFATYRSDRLVDNFRAVYDELERRDLGYEYVFLLKRFPQSLVGQIQYVFHMMRATYELATARYFIIDDYYYPVYVSSLRKGTEVIQLWHACGAFKKFGYSVLDKSYSPDDDYLKMVQIHRNYSKVYVSGEACVAPYADAFGMTQERIYPLGVPRTDQLLNTVRQARVREKLYDRYPEWRKKRIILLAPTFRGNGQTTAHYDQELDFEKFRRELGPDTVLLLRMHPFVLNPPIVPDAYSDQIINMTDYPDINDLMQIADILITDYSSVIFEFALLQKPMIFLVNDLQSYKAERDFYFPYESFVPGPIVSTFEDVIAWIKRGQFDTQKIETFANQFFTYQDGEATKRIVDHLLYDTIPEAPVYTKTPV
ncbi:CDP-glycerol glycerophosphotransferase family protein [Exiguobacterium acetylicum]|uniref:CDP-glycerol glycerophosphotransferase family protein n=1 Tax=Exiguobacterium TaxID=33986 RepID=UPI000700F872|nr:MULTISPECIES: CDP-glycerol glycerophosphotransferase family protein [Exiguobacterium]KQS37253.1 CDP-glycerol--glycerophosphate glycerophosphotransferase [Exiguobacterium sp. Leaf196]MDQ6468266.1 CDP-glycerol glycerophosphotransferase family protein [Exiguobacterium acetylicum]HAK99409.1 CDP-glycerol--glycerophosphate glycerophosphotransferase [Exiguobacterium sp.]HBF59191.1 CDP-glycerol--glycerophosphate glycerophosphotransferase [Exiguobacterium sp.]HCV53844.1 CDP-glycerol--glycerophosphat